MNDWRYVKLEGGSIFRSNLHQTIVECIGNLEFEGPVSLPNTVGISTSRFLACSTSNDYCGHDLNLECEIPLSGIGRIFQNIYYFRTKKCGKEEDFFHFLRKQTF